MFNRKLCDLLISLNEEEKKLRQAILENSTLYEGYNEKLEMLHIKNAEELHGIILDFGWPGKSLVGKRAADAAFMLAQQAISKPLLLKQFLEYLREAVLKEEATPLQLACLEDKILFLQSKPQVYGMLFDWNEAGELYANVVDMEQANKHRAMLGLKTINEGIAAHKVEIAKHGGPPSDYHAHKRLESAWAKRVGWR